MMMISICSDSIGLHMKVNPCRNPSHHIQREMTYEGHENGYRELGRISGTQGFPFMHHLFAGKHQYVVA